MLTGVSYLRGGLDLFGDGDGDGDGGRRQQSASGCAAGDVRGRAVVSGSVVVSPCIQRAVVALVCMPRWMQTARRRLEIDGSSLMSWYGLVETGGGAR